MLSHTFQLVAIVGFVCARAAPLGASASTLGKQVTTNYTATFETDEFGGGIVPAATLPGVYDDLYFGLFQEGPYDYAAGFPIGIAPQSFPAEAVFGYGFTTPAGPASLSAAYGNSAVVNFQLFDFYFGCQAQYNYTYPGGSQVTNYPQNCTMIVNGFPVDDTTVAPTTNAVFDFVPQYQTNPEVGANYSNMVHAVLPASFTGLRIVTFEVRNASSTAVSDPGAYVDNISFAVTTLTEG